MRKEHRGTCRALCAALVAAIFCALPGRAGAQAVNFDLLIETLRERANPINTRPVEGQFAIPGQEGLAGPGPKLKPVEELAEYVQSLKSGNRTFNPGITGEEAAEKFGYSRLFASAYEEMLLHAKAAVKDQQQLSNGAVIAGFEKILQEEQAIDRLMARKERHAAAIAYLRALQNGDVVFPSPQAMAPTPQVLLAQVASANPAVRLYLDDPVFADLYRAARAFAAAWLAKANEIFIPEIVGELRRLIVASTKGELAGAQPNACDEAAALGELMTLVAACPRLRQSDAAAKLFDGIAQLPPLAQCRDKGAAGLRNKLRTMSQKDIADMCERAVTRVQAEKIEFLKIAD